MLKKNGKPSGGALFLLLIVLGLFLLKTALGSGQAQEPLTGDAQFIEISGDVPNPGVIRFFRPATLRAVINQAGLPEPMTPPTQKNPGDVLSSGTRVDFKDTPRGFVVELGVMSAFYKMTLGLPIHLNSATAVDLTAIPGIGPVLAASIVIERERKQGFHTLDEMTEVQGISQRVLEKISPFLVL